MFRVKELHKAPNVEPRRQCSMADPGILGTDGHLLYINYASASPERGYSDTTHGLYTTDSRSSGGRKI